MKAKNELLNILVEVCEEANSFSIQLNKAVELVKDSKLFLLAKQAEDNNDIAFYLNFTYQDKNRTTPVSDGIFNYDIIMHKATCLLLGEFNGSLDKKLLQEKLLHCNCLSFIVASIANGKIAHFRIISTLLFEELPDNSNGYYISYGATSCGKFSTRLYQTGDNTEWRRRGTFTLLLYIMSVLSAAKFKCIRMFLETFET